MSDAIARITIAAFDRETAAFKERSRAAEERSRAAEKRRKDAEMMTDAIRALRTIAAEIKRR